MREDLLVLHNLSSAIRHGDGAAADALQKHEPELFLEHTVEVSWFAYFAYGGYGPAAVRKLDVPLDRLRSFARAIEQFWLLVDALRTTVGTTER